MTITYHTEIQQYTPEWFAIRLGVITASQIDKIITPAKLQFADNEKCRSYAHEIAMQRVIGKTDPTFQNYDMRRGMIEEKFARDKYSAAYAPVTECGFVTNDKWGFKIGCSPDGLVSENGGIEVKSRLKKLQFAQILSPEMPNEYRMQVQLSLMVTEREWWDYISYSGDMNMITIRVYPDPVVIKAIEDAAFRFEDMVRKSVEEYGNRIADGNLRILVTPPTPDEDDIISSSDEQEAA